MVTMGDDIAKLAEEVEKATKVADTAEEFTKITSKVKKVTKAEELSDASKVLTEGGEAAGKGSLVEKVVSKGGILKTGVRLI